MTGLGSLVAIVPCYWVQMSDWWQPWSSFRLMLVSPAVLGMAQLKGHWIALLGVGSCWSAWSSSCQLWEHQAQEHQEWTTSVRVKILSYPAATLLWSLWGVARDVGVMFSWSMPETPGGSRHISHTSEGVFLILSLNDAKRDLMTFP